MRFCPLFILWDFVLCEFVLWDFVRWDYVMGSVPDSLKTHCFKNVWVTHNNYYIVVTMIVAMIVLYGVFINMYSAVVPGNE